MAKKIPVTIFDGKSGTTLRAWPSCVYGNISFKIENGDVARLTCEEVKELIKNLKIMIRNFK